MKLLGIWLLIANAAGYVLMGEDKRRALLKARRVPERALLLAAAAGGSLGVLLGMLSYHHKTRHKAFFLGVPGIMLAQILLAVGAIVIFG